MCGIAGIIGGSLDKNHSVLERMKLAIQHRGPDGEGTYADPEGKSVLLGHRRLAIIDPQHGKQPMTSQDGMATIIFNGAIYNYLELREELISLGHPIRSFCDTEVLLYAYLEWSENCLEKLNGMFAFAIWDRRNQIVFCARDRVGIKPFYYHYNGKQLLFASEIKAILASGYVEAQADHTALQDYITLQFCLGQKTLFKNIYKLEPGYSMIVNVRADKVEIKIKKYWDVNYNIDDDHDESYFIEKLSSLLDDSIQQHLRSDVPIGAHLSGGLDSSAVVCLSAPNLKKTGLKTFSGGFREGPQFDEIHHAKKVAEFVGSENHEIYIPSHEFTSILPKLIYFMDEPLAGPGLIPQYYVSKLAAQHVKVVLGGQGGDELYVGYIRYLVAYLEKCLHGAIHETEDGHKHAISLETIAPQLPLLKSYVPMLQHFWNENLFGSDDKRYFRLIDRSEDQRHLFHPNLFDDYSTFESYQQIFNAKGIDSFINKMTYFDFKASLPALLHVEDRTSMAVSLESRVPLLDHRLVEFMANIPPHVKFSKGQPKHLFQQAVKNILPKSILERKDKMGFPVPLEQWLHGEAKDFVYETIFSQKARQRGIYNIPEIEKFYKNEQKFSRVMWGILCLELWHSTFIDGNITSYA